MTLALTDQQVLDRCSLCFQSSYVIVDDMDLTLQDAAELGNKVMRLNPEMDGIYTIPSAAGAPLFFYGTYARLSRLAGASF